MEALSNIQKEFLEYLCNYKEDSLSKQMCQVLFSFFKIQNKDIKILISDGEIAFFSNNKNIDKIIINDYKNNLIQILFLLEELNEKKYILYYENKKINIGHVCETDFLFEIKYNTNEVIIQLGSQYSISPLLKKYINNQFKTDSQIERMETIKNIQFTRIISIITLIIAVISIIIGIIFNNKSIKASYDIATNIPTTINFKEDEQFKKLISSKQISVKNENNIVIPESFYKSKTELKLEIFK